MAQPRFHLLFSAFLLSVSACDAADTRSVSTRGDAAEGREGLPVARSVSRIESLGERVDADCSGSMITYRDSSVLYMPYGRVELLDAWPSRSAAQWLLLQGVECTAHDSGVVVILTRPVTGSESGVSGIHAAPGDAAKDRSSEEEPEGRMRTRLFIGTCHDDTTPGAVWLQEIRPPVGGLRRRARILRAVTRESVVAIAEEETDRTEDVQRAIEARVAVGTCREVLRAAP